MLTIAPWQTWEAAHIEFDILGKGSDLTRNCTSATTVVGIVPIKHIFKQYCWSRPVIKHKLADVDVGIAGRHIVDLLMLAMCASMLAVT